MNPHVIFLRQTLCLYLALGGVFNPLSLATAMENDNQGRGRSASPGETPNVPGFPPLQMPPGLRIFGPRGQSTPELRGNSESTEPAAQRRLPNKKLSEADKAEALRKALAPKPSIAVLRQQALEQLFQQLAAADDDETGQGVSSAIERIWTQSDSDTANLLMQRGTALLAAGRYPLALEIFDKLVALQPQWAEAWNKRATTRFKADDLDGAMADIGQVLRLEPRHYGALAGMGMILEKSNLDKQALDVFRKALALNPRQPALRALVETLTLKVEGRDI
jgi:tetratricopeptide (TPR) repeat protein